MKIIIVRGHSDELKRDKYNLQEEGLAKALTLGGNRCDVIYATSGKYREEKIYLNNKKYIKIYWLPRISIKNNAIFDLKLLNHIVKQYDMIQTIEYESLVSFYLLKKYPNKTILYHGPYSSEYSKRYVRLSKFFDLVYSKRVKNNAFVITKSYLARDYLFSKGFKNIFPVGVGLDLDKFDNCIIKDKVKKEKLNLLYVGKIEERRNIIFLLRLARTLEKLQIKYEFNIIGTGDETYTSLCIKYVNKYNLNKNVHFLGEKTQKELIWYYNYSDVFLLASKYEIFGMVLLEAMFFKNIVISTDNGGAGILLDNAKNGYVLKGTNTKEWSDILIKISMMGEEKRRIIAGLANRTITQEYDWKKLKNKFLNIYNKRIENEN